MDVDPFDLLRKILILSALAYLIFYAQRGVKEVLREDVGVVVETTPLTSNFSLPYITICPRFDDSSPVGYEGAIFDDVSAKIAVDSGRGARDVTPLINSDQIAKFYRFHSKGQVQGAMMFEPCYTFLQRLDNGRQWIDFNMKNVEDIYLIFHKRLGLASTMFNIHGNDRPFFQSLFSDKGKQLSRYIEIELEVIEKRRRHHTSNCYFEDESKADDGCVERYVENKIGCKLPWSTPETGNNLRLCSNREDFQRMATFLNDTDALSASEMRLYLGNMGCKIPCDYQQYNYRVVLDDSHIEDQESFNYAYLSGDIFLLNEDIRVETEVILYDFISLAANFGGYTGLLLGYSLLTVYDFGVELVDMLKEKFQ